MKNSVGSTCAKSMQQMLYELFSREYNCYACNEDPIA